MEKRCKEWTSESAEAGLGCTRVDERAGERARKFFIWKSASADASVDFVVPKLSCQEDLGISGKCCLKITDLS